MAASRQLAVGIFHICRCLGRARSGCTSWGLRNDRARRLGHHEEFIMTFRPVLFIALFALIFFACDAASSPSSAGSDKDVVVSPDSSVSDSGVSAADGVPSSDAPDDSSDANTEPPPTCPDNQVYSELLGRCAAPPCCDIDGKWNCGDITVDTQIPTVFQLTFTVTGSYIVAIKSKYGNKYEGWFENDEFEILFTDFLGNETQYHSASITSNEIRGAGYLDTGTEYHDLSFTCKR